MSEQTGERMRVKFLRGVMKKGAMLFLLAFGAIVSLNSAYAASGRAASNSYLRIVDVDIFDQGTYSPGQQGAPFVDVLQGVCGAAPSTTAEPFYDTVIGLTISNGCRSTVRLNKFWYRIHNAGYGAPFNSAKISPSTKAEVPAGGTVQVFFLLLKAKNGGKVFTHGSAAIPADLGFRNITLAVQGRDALKRAFKARMRTAISFGDFNRCGS